MDNKKNGNANEQNDMEELIDLFDYLLDNGHFKNEQDKEELFRFLICFYDEIRIIFNELK